MTSTRRTRKPVAIAGAALFIIAAPLLSGCSLVDNFIPGIPAIPEIPQVDVPSASVPEDFPSEVPLIDGDVVLGVVVPGQGGDQAWNVTIKVAGAEAFDTIASQLQDAGYDYQSLGTNTGGFNKDPYTVVVVVSQSGTDWNANYTVTNVAAPQS